MRRLWLAVLCGALVLPGCSIQTAGAPKGKLNVTATFDDAQNLVAGHSVQMSDVKVGTVTSVKLVGYKAKVTLSIKDEYKLPQGTAAEIKVTSLLGENFVQLTMPPNANMVSGPFLRSGAELTRTSVQPAFEQVVEKAGPLLKALAGDDVATVLDAGATALGGNGPKLNGAVAKTGDLVKIFADQREELGRSVEQFAKLGRALAAGSDELEQAPVELAKTTKMLNDNKQKIINAVQKLTRTARLLNDKVLEGRVQQLKTTLRQLDPVLARLGGERARLSRLIDGLVTFEQKLPKATYDGQLLLYPLVKIVLPNGSIFPPPSGGKAKSHMPKGLRDAFPNIDRAMGGGR